MATSSKPKFQTQYNRHETVEEVNNKPSITIPDQSLTVKQILDRYARGLPLGGQRVPIYEGEDDLLQGVDPRKLDLSERKQIQQQFEDELTELKLKFNQQYPKTQKKIDDIVKAKDHSNLDGKAGDDSRPGDDRREE